MMGPVGAILLHAVGDAGHGGVQESGAVLFEAEHHLLEAVMDGGEGVFRLARRPPRL